MGAFEMFLVSGGMLAYWSVYGCSLHLSPTSKQWRTPLSLQIILAVFVMAGSLITCESPRWLAKQGSWDEATKALCSLRGASEGDVEIVEELAEMKAQIDEEIALTNGRRIREMLKVRNLQRLLWGVSVAFFTMWCGHNAILVSAYFFLQNYYPNSRPRGISRSPDISLSITDPQCLSKSASHRRTPHCWPAESSLASNSFPQ